MQESVCGPSEWICSPSECVQPLGVDLQLHFSLKQLGPLQALVHE